jgi:2'-5' RNA ligase
MVITVGPLAKQRLKSPRARLFVALDLPQAVLGGIEAWQRSWDDPALRPVPAGNLHLTLAFLGYRPEREIERIASLALEVGERPAPSIELLAEPVAVPRSRPRLFAVDTRAPAVSVLQQGVSDRLEAERLYRPEKRPFWPHLTLARVKPQQRSSKRPAIVERPPGPLPEALRVPFRAVRMRLYRSYLRPQGAEYVPLAEVELDRPPRTEAREERI